MEQMTFNIDKDTRKLVDATQDYDIDFHDNKYNWLTARQYEDSMRQVEVHVIKGDGSPYDLTGVNPVFEGWLPDSLHRVYDSKHSVVLDPQGGIFRFDFPARAFSVAGSYKQAFFRLMRDSDSIATLEFSLDILADKVISGIVPSDYVSPFEDLYGQLQDIINGAGGKFDSQIADWSKQVNATITNLNADYSEIQTTYNAAKATLDLLQTQLQSMIDKAASDDLVTHKEFGAFKDNVTQSVKDSLTIPDADTDVVDGAIKQEDIPALKSLKEKIDTTKFNILFMTDNHFGSFFIDPKRPSNNNIQHLANADYFDNVDAIVIGGDNIDGYLNNIDALKSDTRRFTDKLFLGSNNNVDKFILLGNHDNGSWRDSMWREAGRADTLPPIISMNDFQNFYRTKLDLNSEHRNNDSLYFYKDYPAKKVRLIGLNSDDLPVIYNDDGSPKYDQIHDMGWSQQQLDWLANQALANFPKDYTALIVQHTPLDGDGDSTFHNMDGIQQILNAFKNGTSKTITGDEPDFGINVVTNFASQGPQKLAGCLHGHLHKESYEQVMGINDIGFTSSTPNPSSSNKTPDSDAFSIVSIDNVNNKVDIKGFGRATDREFVY